MQLDVPFRRVGQLTSEDEAAILAILHDRVAPLYDRADAPLWRDVQERSRYIGQAERPADVAYRKMRPAGYAQICVLNDEQPSSPWARPLPVESLPQLDQEALTARLAELCREAYGEGVLHFFCFAVLAPGGNLPRHRDVPHDVNKRAHSHRVHVPLTGAEHGELILHDQPVFLEPFGLYEIDNVTWHAAENRGDGYRVNILLDYCTRENLAARNAPSPPIAEPAT